MSINGRGFLVPEQVDLDRPSAARVYDWYLGGSANWSIDRQFGERAAAMFPPIKQLAVANRRWLGRVVRAALDAGITQFLDLGSGIPSMGAVHEWVAAHPSFVDRRGRVVYVDNEPVAYAHIEQHLDSIDRVGEWVVALQQDLRNPELIFADLKVQELLNLAEPVCVLAIAVLHFVSDESNIPQVLSAYRRRVAPGSWLAVSHIAHDTVTDSAEAARVEDFVASYKDTQNPLYLRDRDAIATWLETWGDLLEPGVAHLPDWRPNTIDDGPDGNSIRPYAWCGAAVKPSPTAASSQSATNALREMNVTDIFMCRAAGVEHAAGNSSLD